MADADRDEPRYARPANLDDLKAVLRSLNENQVSYLLIGGYALYAHGYYRATTDIDLLLPASRDEAVKLKRALLVLPEQACAEIDPAWFEEGDTIRVADEFVVDVMFNACGETYETLERYREVIDLDGIPVNTVSLEGLLRTKQTVRDKDVMDSLLLQRVLNQLQDKQ
jgi:predicted nucleotidyltransferase